MRRNLCPSDVAVPPAGTAILTLYSRQNCHLCTDMLLLLQAHAIEPNIIDVDTDPALRQRYGAAVPVLCHGDTEICRYHLDMSRLQAHLNKLT